MSKIRVFLADDHAVLRAGLRALLATQSDMEVVGEAADGESCVRGVKDTSPDVLILDLGMAGMNGMDAATTVLKMGPETRVLVLTMHEDEGYFRKMMGTGVAGYLLKRAADVELLSAIRAVYRGETYIDSLLARVLVKDAFGKKRSAPREEKDPLSRLSTREREVFDRVILGYTNQQIADELGIRVKTIETYKARVTEKLQVKTRAELVRYAIDRGLFSEHRGVPAPDAPKEV